jgi:hypothetical protein
MRGGRCVCVMFVYIELKCVLIKNIAARFSGQMLCKFRPSGCSVLSKWRIIVASKFSRNHSCF